MEHVFSFIFLGDRTTPAVALPPSVFSCNAAAVQQLLEDFRPPVSEARLMMRDLVELDPGSAGATGRICRACQITGCPNEFVPTVAGGGPGGVREEVAIGAFSADEDIASTVAGAATM